jgi:6-phosphofructokinase 1
MEEKTPPVPDFTIDRLGQSKFDSPLTKHYDSHQEVGFVEEDEKIVVNPDIENVRGFLSKGIDPPSMEVAGPRKKIYFDPDCFRGAIVTCGGICPGLNNVIRSVFFELHHRYGVKTVIGIRYGFSGLVPRIGRPPVTITTEMVENIHRQGGTFLGSSRGPQNVSVIVDFLVRERIICLFTIGGDGTLRGALEIAMEIVI